MITPLPVPLALLCHSPFSLFQSLVTAHSTPGVGISHGQFVLGAEGDMLEVEEGGGGFKFAEVLFLFTPLPPSPITFFMVVNLVLLEAIVKMSMHYASPSHLHFCLFEEDKASIGKSSFCYF